MSVVLVAGLANVFVVDAPSASAASILYVATTGTDASNSCLIQADPCATISHAVALAAGGDTVDVASGSYDETVVVNVSDLTITGQGASTVVHPDIASQPTFTFNGDGTSLTMVSISAGNTAPNTNGDGIDNSGNSATIENDSVSGFPSYGIANTGNTVTIQDDFISRNNGGIDNQGDTVTMANDTIVSNFSHQAGGGGACGVRAPASFSPPTRSPITKWTPVVPAMPRASVPQDPQVLCPLGRPS